MAINGTHMLFYTSEAEQLRAMLRDIFGFKHVDVGDGWLIFRLPPAEIGVHPAEGPTWESGTRHQITFMCDNINQTIGELQGKGVSVDADPKDEGWGITTTMHLPGGCDVMLYEPRHPIVAAIGADIKRASARKAAPKKSAKKKAARKAAKKTASPSRGRRAKKAGRRR